MTLGLGGRLRAAHRSGSANLFLAISINAFGAGMFFPFALIYYQQVTSLSVGAIGLALTTATFVTLSVNPVTGALVDRFGARRLVVLAQVIEAIGFAGYLVVTSAISLFVAALIATAGTRMFFAAFSTLIAESVAGAERDRWYGLVGITQSIGASLSGFVASLLIGSIGVAGFRTIIIVNACGLVASALLIRSGRREAVRLQQPSGSEGYRVVLRDRVFLRVVGSNVLFILCSMLVGIAFAMYATEALHAPLWAVGFTGILQTGMVVGLQTRVTNWCSTIRRTRSMLFGGGMWMVGCLLFAGGLLVPPGIIVPYVVMTALAFTIAGLFYVPASRALAAELAPPTSQGRYVATFEFSYGLAAAVSPALFGVTYDLAPAMPWLSMSVLVLGAITLLRKAETGIPLGRNRPQGIG
jgi:MFS family permease